MTNSALQLLLKQSPSAVDLIQKTFNLTDGEKYLLLESGVGEGIFFAGQKHAAIKIVASYVEDKIVTTNPEQLLEMEKIKAEFDKKVEETNIESAAQSMGQPEEQPAEQPAEQPVAEQGEQPAQTPEVDEVEVKAQQDAAAALLNAESEGQAEADKIRDSLSV